MIGFGLVLDRRRLGESTFSAGAEPAFKIYSRGVSRSPLAQGRGWLCFDGRLDNRAELWSALPGPSGPLAGLSDEALLAAGWDAWGHDLFRRLLGSFAIGIYDSARRELVLARDPMGGRNLVYAEQNGSFFAATDESTLLAQPRFSTDFDRDRLAAYFAMESPADGRTFFRGVRELAPGHLLRVNAESLKRIRFWTPQTEPLAHRNLGELAEDVRGLMAEAVACRLRGASRPGVLLSGGLDSTPIAGLAASSLGATQRLSGFSWVFDRHPRGDERRYILDAGQRFGMKLYAVRCDDALPLSDLPSWPVHPTTPEQNAYRLFHQRSYARARQAGCDRLLSGMCGDQLYSGGEPSWVKESFAFTPLASAVSAVSRALAAGRLRREHLAAFLPWAWRLERRARRSDRGHSWLTHRATSRLDDTLARESWAGEFLRPGQALLLLGADNGHGFAVERHFASREGVELAYPLRDRRLVELFLRLPSSALHQPGQTRPILRRALADLLPASISQRQDKASFESLFVEGVYRRHLATTRRLLFKPDAIWAEWVEPRVVRDALRGENTGTAGLVLWLALSLELWLERRSEMAAPILQLAA